MCVCGRKEHTRIGRESESASIAEREGFLGTHLFARGIYDIHRIAERHTSEPYRVDDRALREEEEEEEEELYHHQRPSSYPL